MKHVLAMRRIICKLLARLMAAMALNGIDNFLNADLLTLLAEQ
jgi:hypothetical protein